MLTAGCKGSSSSEPSDTASLKTNPKWTQCQNDNDCVVSFGPCGEWVSVNQKFQKEQEAWAIRTGASLACPANTTPKPAAFCQNKTCSIQP